MGVLILIAILLFAMTAKLLIDGDWMGLLTLGFVLLLLFGPITRLK